MNKYLKVYEDWIDQCIQDFTDLRGETSEVSELFKRTASVRQACHSGRPKIALDLIDGIEGVEGPAKAGLATLREKIASEANLNEEKSNDE